MRIHNDSWSLVTQKKYAEVLEKIGDENGFLWELQNWEALSETIQHTAGQEKLCKVLSERIKERIGGNGKWKTRRWN